MTTATKTTHNCGALGGSNESARRQAHRQLDEALDYAESLGNFFGEVIVSAIYQRGQLNHVKTVQERRVKVNA